MHSSRRHALSALAFALLGAFATGCAAEADTDLATQSDDLSQVRTIEVRRLDGSSLRVRIAPRTPSWSTSDQTLGPLPHRLENAAGSAYPFTVTTSSSDQVISFSKAEQAPAPILARRADDSDAIDEVQLEPLPSEQAWDHFVARSAPMGRYFLVFPEGWGSSDRTVGVDERAPTTAGTPIAPRPIEGRYVIDTLRAATESEDRPSSASFSIRQSAECIATWTAPGTPPADCYEVEFQGELTRGVQLTGRTFFPVFPDNNVQAIVVVNLEGSPANWPSSGAAEVEFHMTPSNIDALYFRWKSPWWMHARSDRAAIRRVGDL